MTRYPPVKLLKSDPVIHVKTYSQSCIGLFLLFSFRTSSVNLVTGHDLSKRRRVFGWVVVTSRGSDRYGIN